MEETVCTFYCKLNFILGRMVRSHILLASFPSLHDVPISETPKKHRSLFPVEKWTSGHTDFHPEAWEGRLPHASVHPAVFSVTFLQATILHPLLSSQFLQNSTHPEQSCECRGIVLRMGQDQQPPFLNFWMAQIETKRWSLGHCHSPCPQCNA